jgi:putative membrane protein
MMYYGPGVGGWGIALMIFGNIFFWGLLVVAAVAVVRRTGFGQPRSSSVSSSAGVSPQDLLAQRFGRGEISEEQYVHSLQVLSAAAQSPPR